MMDELLEQFLIESRDLVAQAAEGFVALTANPQSTASIDGAFRAIHTLKGSVALFDMDPAERSLHAAEDVLERARKGTAALDAHLVSALIACIDQTDRWIDQIENAGSLAQDATETANRIVATLSSPSAALKSETELSASADVSWLRNLMTREREVLARFDQPLTAFRYAPDADCFFRGDDPLAVVAAVPDLVSLAILPHQDRWPAMEGLEPFSCFSILEGISTATLETVSALFRLMPDQATFAVLGQTPEQIENNALEREMRGHRILRVDAGRVDALGDTLGELLVAINGLTPLAAKASGFDSDFATEIRALQANLERVSGNLYSAVAAVRSVSLEAALRRLPRLVREIAAGLGKSIDFTIEGQTIEVDKQIADGIFEPLLHLLRNALDHGIEAPEKRSKSGKPLDGRISLQFKRDGDMIAATLADDGAGMDAGQIKRIAIDQGVITTEAAAALSNAGALQLIFAPGFTTALEVTDISGRGVGMNAVQTAVEALRGSIEIESSLNVGTQFRMRFPVNALTTRLLVIDVDGERYGIALDQVMETVGISSERLMPLGEGIACVLRGRTIPVLDMATLLGGAPRNRPAAKLLVTRSAGELVALRVDGFGQRIDALVRRPTGLLAAVRGVMGSTVLSDGRVLLVLDLPELAA